MFWRRFVSFIGTIRTDLMVELERNPQAVRQGAAAAVCIAAAGLAMPLISHRAAEQREGADWSARQLAYTSQIEDQAAIGYEPAARIQLASLSTADGGRGGRGSAFMIDNGMDRQALLVHAALRGPLPVERDLPPAASGPDSLNQSELRCLAEAIYYEARSESYRGQVAVAEVVMNRTRSPHYPSSICGVVYQGHTRATGCQFTFTCDGSLNRRPRGRAWERARNIAAQVMLGYTRPVTGRATHYHTTAVNPIWNATLVETVRVGDHIFYRFPSRSERAVLQAALDRRRAAAPAADPLPVDAFTTEAAPADDGRVGGVIPETAPAPQQPAADDGVLEVEAVPPPTDDAGAPIEIAT